MKLLLAGVIAMLLSECGMITQVGSMMPDEILHVRAVEALKENKRDVACATLRALVDAYPESALVPESKRRLAGLNCKKSVGEAEVPMTFFPDSAGASPVQQMR